MFISAALGSLFIAYAIDCAWFKTHFTMIIPNIIAMHKIDFTGSVIPYVLIGGVILLTLVGCIFQYTMSNREERRKRGQQYEELKPS